MSAADPLNLAGIVTPGATVVRGSGRVLYLDGVPIASPSGREGGRAHSVLWPGIDLRPFTSTGDLDPRLVGLQSPVIFHPARLLRWKGVEIGFEAFLLLRKRLGMGSLVLCASENIVDENAEVNRLRRAFIRRAETHGVAEHVHFMDFGRSEMPEAYRASDVVWYPTIYDEPFGLVPLEAMSCGAPLVVSRSGGMLETVVDGETALVVPRRRADALAGAAKRLIGDQDLRRHLVRGGLRRSRDYDLGLFMDELEAIYSSVIRS